MSNKDDNILSLPPLTPEFGSGFDLAQLASNDTARTVDDLYAINNRTVQQKVVIDAIAGKARYAMRRLMDTDQFASVMFNEIGRSIMKLNEDAQGTSYEAYFAAFNDRMMKTSARHIIGLVEVGATTIAREVMRSPRPPQTYQISLWKRLFG